MRIYHISKCEDHSYLPEDAMIDRLLFALAFLSALGSGVMAGLFFAFSAFVMTASAASRPLPASPPCSRSM